VIRCGCGQFHPAATGDDTLSTIKQTTTFMVWIPERFKGFGCLSTADPFAESVGVWLPEAVHPMVGSLLPKCAVVLVRRMRCRLSALIDFLLKNTTRSNMEANA
jgi:hypothetical protein